MDDYQFLFIFAVLLFIADYTGRIAKALQEIAEKLTKNK